ncbi:MAG TPA: ABC transporter substrate-binding protein [Acetobacteraceae bacterium]|jgi:peptide/nickel transport system substrate-binding protein|nr:ABC transporter substrate-binding protein [Acetobacteraceae bacterium]
MEKLVSPERRLVIAGAAASLLPLGATRAQSSPSVLNIAVPSEPGPLDSTPVTSDLLSEIDQHVWETLYIFDPDFRFAPLLAAAMPDVTPDGKQMTIPLRSGVTFHDGTPMTADDVIASLQRWGRLSPRGKLPASYVTSLEAVDPMTIRYTMKQPYAPLLALLAFPNGSPAIMPKRIATAPDPLKEFVGTGPYKFAEQKPDQYVRLTRNPLYKSPPGAPNGYVGTRQPSIEELRFLPVPNPTTRADGMLAGQYAFADNLTPESYARLKDQPNVVAGLAKPAGWPLVIMNTKKGLMSNVLLRRAVQAAFNNKDALNAAFGEPPLWQLEGSIYPEGTDWFAPEAPGYNQNDPTKAAALLKQAGYKGEAVRLLTTTQYDYQYKTAQVLQANMGDAGFKVDLQITDWATLLQRRQDENQWDIFTTAHGMVPDPSLITILNPSYPGWWDTPDKRAALDAFVTEPDHAKRIERWKAIQSLFYSEVPTIKVGSYFNTYAASKKLSGYTPGPWPAFWNAKLG